MNLKKAAFLLGIIVLGAVLPGPIRAEDLVADLFKPNPEDYVQTRTYLGAFGTSSTIDQAYGMDGTYIFWSPSRDNELNLIPSISRSFGFGGLVGYRTGAYAVEVSYSKSWHESTWIDIYSIPATYYGNSSYQAINLDFKRYLFTKFPTQPFFGFGVSFPWITNKDASTTNGISFNDSTISGIGFNLAAGLEIYLAGNFSIFGEAVQRWAGFNQLNGYSGQAADLYLDGDPTDLTNLEGDGLNFFVGGTIGFE